MRILQVPPLWEQLPPKGYGAIEYLVAAQIEEFIINEHNVTTLASGDSTIAGELIPITPKALNHSYNADPEVLRMIQFSECLRRADKYDIIHCHLHSNTGWMALPILAPIALKTVFSLHTFATEDNRRLLSLYPDCNYVAASEAHAKSFGLGFIEKFVHHGIRVQDFIYQPHPSEESYLAFLGRLRPEKGIHVAIEIADKIGLPLKIAGRAKSSDIPYFEEYIKPHIDSGLVEFVGELGPLEKMAFLGNAVALVNPTLIEEPFGLVVIEAMACGTPVIATRNGAMGEIIINEKTGFIIDPNSDVLITPEQIFKLDRLEIRLHVEKNFSSVQMASNYEHIFNNLIKKNVIALNQKCSQNTQSTFSTGLSYD